MGLIWIKLIKIIYSIIRIFGKLIFWLAVLLFQVFTDIFNILWYFSCLELEWSSWPPNFIEQISIVWNWVIFEVFLWQILNGSFQFSMWHPKFLDKLFKSFEELFLPAFVSDFIFKCGYSAFLSMSDDWVEFFDPHNFVLNWKCFKTNDINAGMNIKTDRIIDRYMNVNELQRYGSLYFTSFFRAIVNVRVVKDEVIFFPTYQISTPHVQNALHNSLLYIINDKDVSM